MRADRLVAILLMLQNRGLVTANEVAVELEISERTARRDLEALGMAGLPIYSQQGRGGGWRLMGGGKTDLSGLNAAEARALFLVAGPSSTATPELRAALRKLVRALPESFREHAEAASTALVIDPLGWGHTQPTARTPPHLDLVQQAVIEGEQLVLGYVARDRAASTRTVHPLGVAAKGTVWYLVADTDNGLRTFRIDRITDVERTGERVARPDGFDLTEAWQLISDAVEEKRTPLRARALVAAHAVPWLRATLDSRMRIGPTIDDGRVEVELRGHHPRSLAAEIAGFGDLLEVLDPPELRVELSLIGTQLSAAYSTSTPSTTSATSA